MHAHRFAFLLACGLLVACGGDKAGANAAAGEDGLPKPAAASGSVTGMPNPGVADARPAAPRTEAVIELPEPVDAAAADSTTVDPALPPAPADAASPALPDPPATPPVEVPAASQPAPPAEA